jgi:polar amino acid transport system substrate-binding protein
VAGRLGIDFRMIPVVERHSLGRAKLLCASEARRFANGKRGAQSRRAALYRVLAVIMMKSRLIVVALAILFAACDRTGASKGALRVGMDLTYPPFQMFVEMPAGSNVTPDALHKQIDGVIWEIDGASVKLAEALAKDLGRPLEIVTMKLQDLIPALNSGRIDVIVASMSITEKRRELIAFSEPYAQTGLGMLVMKSSPIQSLEDLKKPGCKVVVRKSTTGEEFARNQLSDVRCEVVQENAQCVRHVMDDPNAAFVYDYLSLWKVQKRLPGRTRVIPKLLDQESWGIGVRKTEPATLQRVNAFLAKFRAAGGFQQLTEKYLPEEQKFLAEQGLPPLFR